jgi:hypothetical protein
MHWLGLLFTLALLAVNLWGLMRVAGTYWRNRWLGLAPGPILAATGIYAIECQHGLGTVAGRPRIVLNAFFSGGDWPRLRGVGTGFHGPGGDGPPQGVATLSFSNIWSAAPTTWSMFR